MTNANAYDVKKTYKTDEKSFPNHELGGTLGATVGGVAAGIAGGVATVAAGATLGGLAGPIGAVVGAAIGGAIGGAAGESIARSVSPTEEELYWERNYKTRAYIDHSADYETSYKPAYRYGVDAYSSNEGRSFEEVEPNLRNEWETKRGTSKLDWERAKPAVQDSYGKLYNSVDDI